MNKFKQITILGYDVNNESNKLSYTDKSEKQSSYISVKWLLLSIYFGTVIKLNNKNVENIMDCILL